MRRLVTRPQAEIEVEAAAAWYDEEREGLGDEFLAEVRAAAARALEAPARYPQVHRHMRRVLLERFPYLLVFRATSDEVLILACVHGHRDPRVWRSRR